MQNTRTPSAALRITAGIAGTLLALAAPAQLPSNPTPEKPPHPDARPGSAANCTGIADWAHQRCVDLYATAGECDTVRADTETDCELLVGEGDVHVVSVYHDGTFAPADLGIASGDTVLWSFYDRGEAVIPVSLPLVPTAPGSDTPAESVCRESLPWDDADPNAFTGPARRAPSGAFLLNPERKPGDADDKPAVYEAMTDEAFTGVALRIQWSDIHTGPGEFDWTYFDQLVGPVVDRHRLFNLVIKAGQQCSQGECGGTPEWIFDPDIAGVDAARPVSVMSAGSFPAAGSCGVPRTLGSPADANYRSHYFAMLEAVAAHLKENNRWYQALAYIKPSGANLFSGENRLPNQCWSPTGTGLTADECQCLPPNAPRAGDHTPCVCNPQVWSVNGYTPADLYDFYSLQHALLARLFPGKTLSYMLIQAGFPRVNNAGEYEGQQVVDADGDYRRSADPARNPRFPLPGALEQTSTILERSFLEQGYRLAVQHNALTHRSGPNPLVEAALARGQFTGYQTSNNLNKPRQLGSALQSAVDFGAVFVELYQKDLFRVDAPIPTFAGQSLAEWEQYFHRTRRQSDFRARDGDPFPYVHGHSFTRTEDGDGDQLLQYIITPGCDKTPQVGAIRIAPE